MRRTRSRPSLNDDFSAIHPHADLERADGDRADLERLRLYATASRSDRTHVRRLLEQDTTLALIERASVLALAGDRDGAVAGVAAALLEKHGKNSTLALEELFQIAVAGRVRNSSSPTDLLLQTPRLPTPSPTTAAPTTKQPSRAPTLQPSLVPSPSPTPHPPPPPFRRPRPQALQRPS